MYSIFAGYVSDVKVYSFEPESNNFQVLMENILLNNLVSKISPYPIGISNLSGLTTLYLSNFKKGSSHHVVGESLDHNLNKKEAKLKQGIFSSTLVLEKPTHLANKNFKLNAEAKSAKLKIKCFGKTQ